MTNMQDTGIVPTWELRHRLQRAREMTGLEQAEFADELGVSRNSVSNAERGTTTPREITLRAWALRTGVPLAWIKTGEAPTVPPNGIEPLTYSLQGAHFRPLRTLRAVA